MEAGEIDQRFWGFTFDEDKAEEIVESITQIIWITYMADSENGTYFV